VPAKKKGRQALGAKFAAFVAQEFEVAPEQIELAFQTGDVEVPGYVAMSARIPDMTLPYLTVRGWVREKDGEIVIPQHTKLSPFLEELGFAERPPPIDDERLAALLAWGYGDRYTLLRRVAKGDLGMRSALSCPPVRERRKRDGATVFRYVMRVEKDPENPAIMALAIARTKDGKYRFDGWQLAPKGDGGGDD
jgi:hypothetical protein